MSATKGFDGGRRMPALERLAEVPRGRQARA